jgi:hypothetical protein
MFTDISEVIASTIVGVMSAGSTSERSVNFYQITWHYKLDSLLCTHCCKNLKILLSAFCLALRYTLKQQQKGYFSVCLFVVCLMTLSVAGTV